jgi:hypothetical protein
MGRMVKGMLAALAAVSIVSGAALADEKKADEKKPEMAKQKPGPEIEKLGYFQGNWTSAGQMKASPMGPAGETSGRDMCGWMPGGFFMVCRMESQTPSGPIQVLGIMGYDSDKKAYTWASFNSMGMTETATGAVKDGTWTWSNETKVGGKMMKTRYVMADTAPESYTFRWETSADGKTWNAVMEGKATKAARKTAAPPAGAPAPPPAKKP